MTSWVRLRPHQSPELFAFELDRLRAVLRARQDGTLWRPDGWPVLNEMDRRLIRLARGERPAPYYDGLTWVLDLLPQAPLMAIDVITAYLWAYGQALPDLRVYGLDDARSLIRARYIDVGDDAVSRIELLGSLTDREFEYFCAVLWNDCGYDVVVTPGSKDGGKDLVCRSTTDAGDIVYVECRSGSSPSDVTQLDRLGGVISRAGVPRGIIVALSGFTAVGQRSAVVEATMDDRLHLVSGTELIRLANAHLGHDWPTLPPRGSRPELGW